MTTETQHYGFTKLGPGESIHAGDGKFPSADRDKLDQLLYQTVQHHHTGSSYTELAPDDAPDLVLSTTGGTLPAGTTIRYCYTFVDPISGETIPSPVAAVTTPDPIDSPAAPTAAVQTIGGSLPSGSYFYVVTAYQGTTAVETKASNPIEVVIPAGTSTNSVTLTMPALPAGATGFNVYRRTPNGIAYHHIAETTASTLDDVGSDLALDPNTYLTTEAADTTYSFTGTFRSLPPANTTNGTNSVTVTVPSVPAGYLWVIYRSYSASFVNSRLAAEDEFALSYVDVGAGTDAGTPPDASYGIGQPEKVLLTDAAEVQGVLPVENGGTGAITPLGARTELELGNVDNTSDAAKPISTATQTALNAKAPIASPTFTGTVSGITKTMVGLGNVDNTSDAAKPVSTATQTALDAKVAKATFPVTLTYDISGDEVTALTTGTAKYTVRAPFAFTLTAVRASLSVASSSGNPTFDINEGGTSVLGANKLAIDASEKTSTTAATATTIADAAIADDAEITFDIDVAGTGAAGAKITLIGTRVLP